MRLLCIITSFPKCTCTVSLASRSFQPSWRTCYSSPVNSGCLSYCLLFNEWLCNIDVGDLPLLQDSYLGWSWVCATDLNGLERIFTIWKTNVRSVITSQLCLTLPWFLVIKLPEYISTTAIWLIHCNSKSVYRQTSVSKHIAVWCRHAMTIKLAFQITTVHVFTCTYIYP